MKLADVAFWHIAAVLESSAIGSLADLLHTPAAQRISD